MRSRKRIRLLEQENEVLRRTGRRRTCREEMYPLVRDLAAEGIPVTVTCGVRDLARQLYSRWSLPGHRLPAARGVPGQRAVRRPPRGPSVRLPLACRRGQGRSPLACDRTMWRVCSRNGWWSAFAKTRGKNGKKPGPSVHRRRRATLLHRRRPQPTVVGAYITEHKTSEGKLYLRAIKDVFSNRIVGYSISDRMKSRLAVDALANTAPRRGDVAGCLLHTDRAGSSAPGSSSAPCTTTRRSARWERAAPRRQRRHGVVPRATAEERPRRPHLGHPPRAADRDLDLD